MKQLLIGVLLVGCAASRTSLTDQLTRSGDAFLSEMRGLSEQQLRFKPAPDQWSIAEVAEHVAVTEDALYKRITSVIIPSPTSPEMLARVQPDDQRITRSLADRTNKRQAPEPIRPTGRFANGAAVEQAFAASREKTLDYVRTSKENFRAHAAEHPALGVIDAQQWFVLMAAHSARHTEQIREVKARLPRP